MLLAATYDTHHFGDNRHFHSLFFRHSTKSGQLHEQRRHLVNTLHAILRNPHQMHTGNTTSCGVVLHAKITGQHTITTNFNRATSWGMGMLVEAWCQVMCMLANCKIGYWDT